MMSNVIDSVVTHSAIDQRGKLFGEHSWVEGQSILPIEERYVGRSAYRVDGFNGVLLCFVIYYLIWLGRYLAFVQPRKLLTANFFGAENRSNTVHYNLYLDITFHLLYTFIYLLLAMLCFIDISPEIESLISIDIGSSQMAALISGHDILTLLIITLAITTAIGLWGLMVITVSSIVARSSNLLRELAALKFNSLIFTTTIITPLLVMGQLQPNGNLIIKISLLIVFLSLIAYIFRTFYIFISKKISLLLWILYLCTVEVFPLTLIWGIFVRENI